MGLTQCFVKIRFLQMNPSMDNKLNSSLPSSLRGVSLVLLVVRREMKLVQLVLRC